jgi:hypothetical protein
MSGGDRSVRENMECIEGNRTEDKSSPVIVWESARVKAKDGQGSEKDNVLPFHRGGGTAEVESEAVVTERTIRVGVNRLPVKITLVTSGFGEMKACLGNGALCKAA